MPGFDFVVILRRLAQGRRAIPVFIALVLLASSFLLYSPLQQVDEKLVGVHYFFRGEVTADTNIAIIYFDAKDISALGGWPLRRNYYALLIETLTKLEAKVIGTDIFFGSRNREFPEYDILLASMLEKTDNVVLSSYFRSVSLPSMRSSGNHNSPTGVRQEWIWRGEGYQLPFESFLHAAAGVGHTHLGEGNIQKVPVFISDGSSISSPFFLELYRKYRNDIESSKERSESSIDNVPDWQIRKDGTVWINFPGSFGSFKMYRAVDVIRGFEFEKHGIESSLDLDVFRGKIALIGVIAEGFGTLYNTPFSEAFPPIGIHATLLDNALQGRFLSITDRTGGTLISLLLFVLGLIAFQFGGNRKGIYIVLGVFILYFFVTAGSFIFLHTSLPLLQPVLVYLLPLISMAVIEHRRAQTMVHQLSEEKKSIESNLREKELQLSLLEDELVDEKEDERKEGYPELTERVRRIKEDVRDLSKQVNDLTVHDTPKDTPKGVPKDYERIVYDDSSKMSHVVSMIDKVAGSDANILILGESGTGKEMVARAIHARSARKDGSFVAVNCGAITETLLESELFGHERGAFTGAVKDKQGRFELANKGTILLDEIAETSPAFQVKLLRVIQESEFERVGSSKTTKVDVRIIAATNKDIKALVDTKQFRDDLYYRLNVFSIHIPPLRERKADIAALTDAFLRKEDEDLTVSEAVMNVLKNYSWPGNVRELEMALKRAAILARSEQRPLLRLKDFPVEVQQSAESMIELEDKILESLRMKDFSRSSISETAQELGGLNRSTISEYFRGICFRAFFNQLWDYDAAASEIAGTDTEEVLERVTKKLHEYLSNVTHNLDRSKKIDDHRDLLKSKFKNLPQKFHPVLEEVVRSYLDGKWSNK